MTSPQNARSALNLRLALALFGVVSGTVGAAACFAKGRPVLGGLLLVLAVVAMVNVLVVQVRRRERRRTERRSGGPAVDHNLFE